MCSSLMVLSHSLSPLYLATQLRAGSHKLINLPAVN